jgi:hypothetical protein
VNSFDAEVRQHAQNFRMFADPLTLLSISVALSERRAGRSSGALHSN